ncbi:MAG TPA: hypothetical protein V6D43_07710 [Candidatus Sericytochromatia bacterium]|jgi:hypothetical protein
MSRNESYAQLCQHYLLGAIILALISRSRSHLKQEESVNQCRLFLSDKLWQQESGA